MATRWWKCKQWVQAKQNLSFFVTKLYLWLTFVGFKWCLLLDFTGLNTDSPLGTAQMDCVRMVFEEYSSSEYLTFQDLIRFLATTTSRLRSRSVHKEGHSLLAPCLVTGCQLTENSLESCCLCNIYHLTTCQSAMSFTFIGSHLNHLLQSLTQYLKLHSFVSWSW